MKPATGRWVSGDDFFGRKPELRSLENLASEYNPVLLTGQRRIGKTSIVQELGRRLESKGWVFIFVDVEGAECPEDVVARIAAAAHPVLSRWSRFIAGREEWFGGNIDEVKTSNFYEHIRAMLNVGNWRNNGKRFIYDCVAHDKPVFLAIDELPIFLNRMRRKDGNAERVDMFMSWFREVLQTLGGQSPAVILSGSIGLAPLMRRLDLPDRINYLHPFRLEPWNRDDSIRCFECLAESNSLQIDDGVAAAVYDKLGVGIPQYVQSFFACLRDLPIEKNHVTVEDVNGVYNKLLQSMEQSVLPHYDKRLKDALDEDSYTIAREILAEAAVRNVFTPGARRALERGYPEIFNNAPDLISDVLDVLIHDGYLEKTRDHNYRFLSRLLKDWWSMRFDNYVPLEHRFPDGGRES